MNERERSLDPQLWHACAGGMVQLPPFNSLVFFFPQGHAEHASSAVVFPNPSRIPHLVLCRVASVNFLADPETDVVFAAMGLIPLHGNGLDIEDDVVTRALESDRDPKRHASFAKMLTQSEANNGGGFSVPRYCAETIFPVLTIFKGLVAPCCLSDNAPAGIQGARQAQFGIMSASDHLNLKFPMSPNLQHFDPHCFYPPSPDRIALRGDSLSCLLTTDVSSQKSSEKKVRFVVLFGKPILTEQQIASHTSCVSASEVVDGKNTTDGYFGKPKFLNDASEYSPRTSELSQDTGHCKVFMESEVMGRTLDLTILGSYNDLYRKLTNMFGIERLETLSHVLYEDTVGGIKRVGNEPFSDFIKTAKTLTIFMHPCGGSGSSVGRQGY